MPELICEVCEDEPGLGVACIPGLPISVAFGYTCLMNGANPYDILRTEVAISGGVDQTADWILEGIVYVPEDKAYMTLRHALWKRPLTSEELDRFGGKLYYEEN